jgi:hypothetical protein
VVELELPAPWPKVGTNAFAVNVPADGSVWTTVPTTGTGSIIAWPAPAPAPAHGPGWSACATATPIASGSAAIKPATALRIRSLRLVELRASSSKDAPKIRKFARNWQRRHLYEI